MVSLIPSYVNSPSNPEPFEPPPHGFVSLRTTLTNPLNDNQHPPSRPAHRGPRKGDRERGGRCTTRDVTEARSPPPPFLRRPFL